MAGLHNEPAYKPKKSQEAYQPDFFIEKDMDYTTPYPCGVCKRTFTSRYELATHAHPRRTVRA